MVKTGNKLPNFCLNRIRPHVRVPIKSKPAALADSNSAKTAAAQSQNKLRQLDVDDDGDSSIICNTNNNAVEDINNVAVAVAVADQKLKLPSLGNRAIRKIMIVVDSSFEAEGALQWALTHTVQNQDKLVLLHVIKPPRSKATGQAQISKETAPRAFQLIQSFRNICQLKRPEVEIEVAVVEGKEKGPAIVEEARRQEASLLILGQRKRSTTWRLLMMWAAHRINGSGSAGGVVEYCIQNASCVAIAVRRKNKKLGGYLITTKRQKDFWLLA